MKLLMLLNLIITLLISCGSDISGGVEEGNVVSGISGTVISPDGDTLSNIIVDIKFHNSESNNSSDSVFCDTTDKNGKFTFSNIPPLLYKLSVLQSSDGAIILDSILYENNDTLEFNLLLKRTGAYKYSISTEVKESTNFYIPGTSYRRSMDSGTTELIFSGLPEGYSPTIINANNGHLIIPDTSIIDGDTINTNIMSVLMISDHDTTGESNFLHQRSIIRNLNINVITLSSSQINDSVLSGMAAIYLSYLADTSTELVTLLNETEVPLVVANHNFFPLLGLSDTSNDTGVTYGTENTYNSLVYFTNDSPILKYYDSTGSGTEAFDLGGPGDAIWGISKTGESERLIVSSRDNSRCHLFTYESGSETFKGTLNKRAVGLFTGDIKNSLSSDKLIGASILWAAKYL